MRSPSRRSARHRALANWAGHRLSRLPPRARRRRWLRQTSLFGPVSRARTRDKRRWDFGCWAWDDLSGRCSAEGAKDCSEYQPRPQTTEVCDRSLVVYSVFLDVCILQMLLFQCDPIAYIARSLNRRKPVMRRSDWQSSQNGVHDSLIASCIVLKPMNNLSFSVTHFFGQSWHIRTLKHRLNQNS